MITVLGRYEKQEKKDKQYKDSLLYYHKSKNDIKQKSDKVGDTQSFHRHSGFSHRYHEHFNMRTSLFQVRLSLHSDGHF